MVATAGPSAGTGVRLKPQSGVRSTRSKNGREGTSAVRSSTRRPDFGAEGISAFTLTQHDQQGFTGFLEGQCSSPLKTPGDEQQESVVGTNTKSHL